MHFRFITRWAVMALIAVLVSACSLFGSKQQASRSGVIVRGPTVQSNECQWNRSSCIHEGRYDTGERAFAEQEARRLNQASLDRLMRNAGL